jgi:hypothetical protein
MRFDVVRIFGNAFHGTDFNALWQIVMTNAFGAQLRVDDINFFALGDRPIGAFRLAHVAIDTFVVNNKGHSYTLSITQVMRSIPIFSGFADRKNPWTKPSQNGEHFVLNYTV